MGGRSTILIVEDDRQLAELACEILGMSGYVAIFRTSVADALDHLAEHASKTVALFTDVALSSPMTGVDLAIHVGQEWPEIRICVTSGVALTRSNRLPDCAVFLPKPWRLPDLHAFADTLHCGATPGSRDPLACVA